jgi:hypothetical protein
MTVEEPLEYPWKGGIVRCDRVVAKRIEDALDEFLYPDWQEDGDETDWPSGPTGEPFCGCETCVKRETIALVMAMTLQGAMTGLIELVLPLHSKEGGNAVNEPYEVQIVGVSVYYEQVHQRLRKERGRAAEYPCPCGVQAQDWALIGEGRWSSPNGHPFTDDLDAYEPRCKKCHSALDTPRVCPHGRDTVRYRNGACAECSRANARRQAALIREAAKCLGIPVRQYMKERGRSEEAAKRILEETAGNTRT